MLENFSGVFGGAAGGKPPMSSIERETVAVAKIIELTSRSDQSFEDAVEQGLQKATDSVNNVQSAWVKDQQVLVENGAISTYQVTLKVTFVVQ